MECNTILVAQGALAHCLQCRPRPIRNMTTIWLVTVILVIPTSVNIQILVIMTSVNIQILVILPHSAPSWILSLAENLASFSLQDGARIGTMITLEPASRPASQQPASQQLTLIFVSIPQLVSSSVALSAKFVVPIDNPSRPLGQKKRKRSAQKTSDGLG